LLVGSSAATVGDQGPHDPCSQNQQHHREELEVETATERFFEPLGRPLEVEAYESE